MATISVISRTPMITSMATTTGYHDLIQMTETWTIEVSFLPKAMVTLDLIFSRSSILERLTNPHLKFLLAIAAAESPLWGMGSYEFV